MTAPFRAGVTITRLGKLDIEDVFDWYNARSADLGEEFVQAFNEALDRIVEYPNAAPLVWKERVRQFVMSDFPYNVYYVYQRKRIRVIAVMHWQRDPWDWQVRVR